MSMQPRLPYIPRTQQAHRLLRAIKAHPLVVLSAPRGHGKTVLIEHTVVPALQEAGWRVASLTLQARPLPGLLTDLRRLVSRGDSEIMKHISDHGGAPAYLQVAQALQWLVQGPDHPHLLIIEDVQHLAEPGHDQVIHALRSVLRESMPRLHVLFTVSSRAAMEILFGRRTSPFYADVMSLALDTMRDVFIIDRIRQLNLLGITVSPRELADCQQRLSFNLRDIDQLLSQLLRAPAITLAEAERRWRAERDVQSPQLVDTL